MAIFSSKKNTKAKAEKAESAPVQTSSIAAGLAGVLKSPRITEKASMQQGTGIYTFDVASNATKTQIIAAVRAIYKVTPKKVAIVQVPEKKKRSMRTGRVGIKQGGKKAYVYLKSGETITIA